MATPTWAAELMQLVGEHPLRERLRGQLMLALYRCGRQAEALEVYRMPAGRCFEERGLEPGAALRELEAGILREDPKLGGPSGLGAPLPRGRRGGLLIAAGGVALLVAAAVAAVVALSDGDDPPAPRRSPAPPARRSRPLPARRRSCSWRPTSHSAASTALWAPRWTPRSATY